MSCCKANCRRSRSGSVTIYEKLTFIKMLKVYLKRENHRPLLAHHCSRSFSVCALVTLNFKHRKLRYRNILQLFLLSYLWRSEDSPVCAGLRTLLSVLVWGLSCLWRSEDSPVCAGLRTLLFVKAWGLPCARWITLLSVPVWETLFLILKRKKNKCVFRVCVQSVYSECVFRVCVYLILPSVQQTTASSRETEI